jgi:hypothetical protein
MKTYARHFDDDRTCEAPDCRVQTRSLWRIGPGLTRACTAQHAAAAERAWLRSRHIPEETTR